MLGHRVRVYLTGTGDRKIDSVDGELRKQSIEGVWLYHGWAEQAAVHFYPQHRILEIADLGQVPR